MVTTQYRETQVATNRHEPVIAQGLLSDVLIVTPEPPARTDSGNGGSRSNLPGADCSVVDALQARLHVLVSSCGDALSRAVQHLQGEDSWVIGPLPNCGPLAEEVEAAARAVLAHSHLNAQETESVAEVLKSAGDLRAAARGARQAVQLAHLIRTDAAGREALETVSPLGDAALALARATGDALSSNDPVAARNAALRYRAVDAARQAAERELRSPHGAALFAPTMVRMVRASLWHLAVAGESMARVAARAAARVN